MDPIRLTEIGDKLLPLQKSSLDDGDQISLAYCMGLHNCNGGTGRLYMSDVERYQRIHCSVCHMSIPVGIEVKTYGDLRDWCASEIEDGALEARGNWLNIMPL